MAQQIVTFSDHALHVDSSTIYHCWKSGDVSSVHADGQTYFVSAGMMYDLASEGLIHQDGLCGKGWIGNTGFCKRVTKIKGALTSPGVKRAVKAVAGVALIAGAVTLAAGSYGRGQRRVMKKEWGETVRKGREAAAKSTEEVYRKVSNINKKKSGSSKVDDFLKDLDKTSFEDLSSKDFDVDEFIKKRKKKGGSNKSG